MSILVGGAGWGVILRAGSVKLEASGLLESQNGHCGAGACIEGHEGVPRHIVGLGEQATACGKGPRSLGRRQGRAMGSRWERTKHVPGRTLTGETLDVSPATERADTRSKLLKDFTRLYSCGSAC